MHLLSPRLVAPWLSVLAPLALLATPQDAAAPAAQPPAAASAATTARRAPAAELPPDTLAHLEVAAGADAARWLDGTALMACLRDETMQEFIAPSLKAIREDLQFLMRKAPEAYGLLFREAPGRVTCSLLSVDPLAEDEDERATLVMTAELPGRAGAIFALAVEKIREENEGDVLEIEIAGRKAIVPSPEDEDAPPVAIVLDGERLVLALGKDVAQQLLAPRVESLASSEAYREVVRGLDTPEPLLFGYANMKLVLDRITDGIRRAASELEDEEARKQMELAAEGSFQSPAMKGMRSAGIAWGVEGESLRDRMFFAMTIPPEDRPNTGPVGDALVRHTPLVSAEADLLATGFVDVADQLARMRKEMDRTAALAKAKGLETPENQIAGALDAVRTTSGIDLEKELIPALGNHWTWSVELPVTNLTIPSVGIVLDLKDPKAIEAILAKLVENDDRIDVLNFEKSTFQDHELVTAKLVNAAMPILPTGCVHEGRLLLALTPTAMKSTLAAIADGKTMAKDPRIASFLADTPPEVSGALWLDVGGSFRWLYGFVGVALSALRMQGVELGERFDPSLLPPGDVIADYLGTGVGVTREVDGGFLLEGRSALGNPVTGVLLGLGGMAGLMGASEGLRVAVAEAKETQSRENLEAIAQAMEAYRGTVGGGSYPTSLVHLVDRGMLMDPSKLLDPADPKPKRLRAGNDERLAVSYEIVSADSLPAGARGAWAAEAKAILVTREGWHRYAGGKARLAIALGTDDAYVTSVSEESWTQKR